MVAIFYKKVVHQTHPLITTPGYHSDVVQMLMHVYSTVTYMVSRV